MRKALVFILVALFIVVQVVYTVNHQHNLQFSFGDFIDLTFKHKHSRTLRAVLRYKFKKDGGLSIKEALFKLHGQFDIEKATEIMFDDRGFNGEMVVTIYPYRDEKVQVDKSVAYKIFVKMGWAGKARIKSIKLDSLIDNPSRSLFKAATGFDYVAFPNLIAERWTEQGSGRYLAELIVAQVKTGGFPEGRIIENPNPGKSETATLFTVVWASRADYLKRVYGSIVPWGDYNISYSKKGMRFELHDPLKFDEFRKMFTVFLKYFGEGPWEEILIESLKLAEKGIPVEFGGSCAKEACQVFDRIEPAKFGFSFYPPFEVSSNYNQNDKLFTFKIGFENK